MRSIFTLALVVLAAAILLVRMVDRGGRQPGSPPAMAASVTAASPVTSANSRNVMISRGQGGHFWTDARVDGRRLEMVVDTGASQVALRASDAARLGIHPTARDFSVKVSTANGVTRAAPIELARVEIGDIVVRQVQALVQPDEALGVNLLGMSFLSRVRWSHERGKLVLEQ